MLNMPKECYSIEVQDEKKIFLRMRGKFTRK
jgi:hypothetical protein